MGWRGGICHHSHLLESLFLRCGWLTHRSYLVCQTQMFASGYMDCCVQKSEVSLMSLWLINGIWHLHEKRDRQHRHICHACPWPPLSVGSFVPAPFCLKLSLDIIPCLSLSLNLGIFFLCLMLDPDSCWIHPLEYLCSKEHTDMLC